MELEDTNLDLEISTLPGQLDDFPLPVFDTQRPIPFSPSSPGKSSLGRPRTMKEYEEDLASLKKENFNLKVRIYFLEQHRMDPNLPKDVDELRNLYTNLKVEHDLQKKDLETKENLLLDTYKALDVQKQQLEAITEENQELRCRIENLEKELKDYHQRFMETSVPLLDDTNALYTMTFGLNTKSGPSAQPDPSIEEKVRELEDELAKEKEKVAMLEEEMCHFDEKTVDDQKNVEGLVLQLRNMEESLKKIVEERNRYEELYSNASTITARLEKSLRKRMEVIKEKDGDAEKWKSIAEELRKQLTLVENQLQELQERNSKSQSEKHIKSLFAENEKLKHEVRYLQQLAEKRLSKGRTSEPSEELVEARQQQAELLRELDLLRENLTQSKTFIQVMLKEKKQLQAQMDKLKRTVRNLSGASVDSAKEEVRRT